MRKVAWVKNRRPAVWAEVKGWKLTVCISLLIRSCLHRVVCRHFKEQWEVCVFASGSRWPPLGHHIASLLFTCADLYTFDLDIHPSWWIEFSSERILSPFIAGHLVTQDVKEEEWGIYLRTSSYFLSLVSQNLSFGAFIRVHIHFILLWTKCLYLLRT